MPNDDEILARTGAILADLADRRNERAARAIETLAVVKQKLAWRRARGFGYWLGPPSRFPAICGEVDLFYVTIDPASVN